MPRNAQKLALLLLVFLIIAAIAGYYRTTPNDAIAPKKVAGSHPVEQAMLVDQSPLMTARICARMAATPDEGEFANEALRLGDRSVDLAFSMALRDAELNPPAESAQVKEIDARIEKLQAQNKVDQDIVKEFTAMLANPGKSDPDEIQEQLETAKAQQGVTEDELEDAKESLLSAGGDRQTRIQQMHDEYQAAQQDGTAVPAQAKLASFVTPANLVAQIKSWRSLHGRIETLKQAQQQASDRAQELTRKHDQLKQNAQTAASVATHGEAMASLHRIALEKKMLADYTKRIQDEQKLAQTYAGWSALVGGYEQHVMHSMLLSSIWILLIVAAVVAAEGLVNRFYREGAVDRRKAGTMRMALRFTTQVGGVLAILLVVFGPPGQLSTFIALTGAGLTVALKDFIVAFFGWFVLMGRNGIRVGDWVEINGIGGEVVEIGVLRTVILETGNWNDAGHPTGRKVAFVNSFAIEGHYFNFSTTGQWLWDELEVLVPAGKDPYDVSEGVRKIVGEATATDVELAQQEWQRATQSKGMKNFSAMPAIDVRATGAGVNIVVRYITRANVRYDLRSKLNQSIVELLHGHAEAHNQERTTAAVAPKP
jgi:small-conductance mechanosensitive channel